MRYALEKIIHILFIYFHDELVPVQYFQITIVLVYASIWSKSYPQLINKKLYLHKNAFIKRYQRDLFKSCVSQNCFGLGLLCINYNVT